MSITKYVVTAWNIEWLGKLMHSLKNAGTNATQRQKLESRLTGIHQAIHEIAPDVLCITEGPKGEEAIDEFTRGLTGYVAVKRPRNESYHQAGDQWIWFLVREPLLSRATLLPIKVWREYTAAASPEKEHQATWPVHDWGKTSTTRHGHFRHPQVLMLNLGGTNLELIGGHFKSKLTKVGNFTSSDPAVRDTYIKAAIQARVKLGTEAQNVRYYIDQRFRQEPSPAIMVLGDLNDGPGKEFFERQFLFFDLLNNLQGNVFEAEKFLNHALFDYPNDLRWTVHFKDPIEPNRDPRILLDHIMFTQALVNKEGTLRVHPKSGKIEHEIFERITAMLPSGVRLSDHKPVSCVVSESDGSA